MAVTADLVLGKAADICCLRGSIHSGEATGEVNQTRGVDTYVAVPDANNSNRNVLFAYILIYTTNRTPPSA